MRLTVMGFSHTKIAERLNLINTTIHKRRSQFRMVLYQAARGRRTSGLPGVI
ncbi:hypothetical protein [Streptomyces coffeae]|uniref:HTH luxR-type domain-containing protein n=1 Tax=Streptomyces coffeae TaxID=621382 RepID=A0ABS1NRL2_9ACTN|nr:hypothetical protein [Streptomyces coffeae]MBL1102739.1 hypothetical protein [Streptomyces coffeae]